MIMKRNFKRVSLGLALALILTTILPLTAHAAGTASITVKGPTSLVLNAENFSAIKLFDLAVEGTGESKSYEYTATAGLEGFLGTAGYDVKYGENADIFRGRLAGSDIDLFELTKDLNAYFNSGGIPATKVGDDIVFDELDAGYYLVIGKGTTDGPEGANSVEVIAHSSLVTVEDENVNINLKADAPTINKEVWNHGVAANDGWTDWTDINMGEDAKFMLTSTVPDMYGYESYTYTVHDYMSKGLSFNDDVEVTIGGVKFEDFEVVEAPISSDGSNGEYAGGTYIKIIFDPAEFVKYEKGDAIVITYTAELNEDAIIGAPGNPNKVWLEYSNNPYDDEDTGETPPDEVIVYTFDLEIYKYTGTLGDGDEPLPGAEFELRDSEGNPIEVIELDDGEYRLATSEDAPGDITTTLVSNDEGKIYIKGLDAGDYELVETKAPEGYNMIPGFITHITIEFDDETGEYNVIANEAETNVVNIQNNKGSELPEAGGVGRTIFYVLGIAMVVGVGVTLFIRRRKAAGQVKVK